MPHISYIIFDGNTPGSGQTFDLKLLNKFNGKYFIAGGINRNNVKKIIEKLNPSGIDTASGIETGGRVDSKKIKSIHNLIK